jgi:hypothetical protein
MNPDSQKSIATAPKAQANCQNIRAIFGLCELSEYSLFAETIQTIQNVQRSVIFVMKL